MAGRPRIDTRWADCDEWPNARNAGGYGIRRWRGKPWLVHRAAWAEAFGDIPDGLDVLHKCDNPPCRNLAHLYLGTDADNGADKKARGRGATNDKRREQNPMARLTTAAVTEIRWRYAQGGIAQRELGARFGVTQGTISMVLRNRTWADPNVVPVMRPDNFRARPHKERSAA